MATPIEGVYVLHLSLAWPQAPEVWCLMVPGDQEQEADCSDADTSCHPGTRLHPTITCLLYLLASISYKCKHVVCKVH